MKYIYRHLQAGQNREEESSPANSPKLSWTVAVLIYEVDSLNLLYLIYLWRYWAKSPIITFENIEKFKWSQKKITSLHLTESLFSGLLKSIRAVLFGVDHLSTLIRGDLSFRVSTESLLSTSPIIIVQMSITLHSKGKNITLPGWMNIVLFNLVCYFFIS